MVNKKGQSLCKQVNKKNKRDVKTISFEDLNIPKNNAKIFVGVDIAKRVHYAALRYRDETQRLVEDIWVVPQTDIEEFTLLLDFIRKSNPVVVGMESSGTYGNPLRQTLTKAGIPVQQVRSKLTHDWAELKDGNPSKHDAKDAKIIAELIEQGRGTAWDYPVPSQTDAELKVLFASIVRKSKEFQRMTGNMEAALANCWATYPNEQVPFTQKTVLKMLVQWGGPPEGTPEEIERQVRAKGNRFKSERVELLIASAKKPLGVQISGIERDYVRELAQDMLNCANRISELDKRLYELLDGASDIPPQLVKVLGKRTAGLIWVVLGDPRQYYCANAWLKAMGLNLTERSSGQHKGQVRISKRGSPLIRKMLYMSAVRLVQDKNICPWYERKKQGRVAKNGQPSCVSSLISVIRKVLRGLYHAIRNGEEFDANRLFAADRRKRELALAAKQTSAGEARGSDRTCGSDQTRGSDWTSQGIDFAASGDRLPTSAESFARETVVPSTVPTVVQRE